jgi:type IV pilus assembly protein PilE
MITVAIIGILAGIALPSYQGYIQRSTLSEAFDALSSFRMRMDQAFNNNGNFGAGACSVAAPIATQNFTFACDLTNAGQGYRVRADGNGRMTGFAFSVDDVGRRVTTPFGKPRCRPTAAEQERRVLMTRTPIDPRASRWSR